MTVVIGDCLTLKVGVVGEDTKLFTSICRYGGAQEYPYIDNPKSSVLKSLFEKLTIKTVELAAF
jgi:hypothetical protein